MRWTVTGQKVARRFDHGELAAVQAELDLKRGKVDDGIVHLESAIPNARTKKERVRGTSWPLYANTRSGGKAIQQFAAVARMNPP